ncbi:hypothetical protein BDV95DRAFT_164677 [Massariosphaeria phaeospora]|uniref:Uncharacterized protein n=1 Tax=Massariosphaeria phaeospora TaxID=100035 RepID=A0A7C8M4B9_9PLEO|nr:hypothetical protein BDV95DRAFT_164677 [Massariosphaeria phaeospora]
MNPAGFLSRFHPNSFPDRAATHVPETPELPDLLRTESKSKTWETTVSRVPSWPEHAQTLKKRNWVFYVYGLGDIILVLLPIYFILLGIAVVTLNGKPTKGNEFGPKVEFAIELGPTLFPIIFAAISGRSMKMIARYLAERGTKLSTLELLMASQSVWGTIESQLLMQRLTLVGANLLFLWALSPLGGQASLRLMTRDDQATYSSTKLRYLTTGPAATMWGLSSTYSGNGMFADAGALYTAALLAPLATKTGPRDSWGNVKIPRMEAFDSSAADSDGWISVPTNLTIPEAYSSLVGIPMVGNLSAGLSKLNLEYNYLSVSCGTIRRSPYPTLPDGTDGSDAHDTNFTRLNELAPGSVWENKTQKNPFEPQPNRITSFFIDSTRPGYIGPAFSTEDETLLGRLDGFVGNLNRSRLNAKEIDTNREFVYASMYISTPGYGLNVARCSLSQHHVEAKIRCERDQCTAEKIRKSLSDTRPSTLTGFEHNSILLNFAQQFPIATPFTVGSSPTERFLTNTSASPFVQYAGSPDSDVSYVNISVIPSEIFSRRLSLVLNTYYQISMQPTGYFGGLPGNLSLYGPDTVPAADINVYLPNNLSATNHSYVEWWPKFDMLAQTSDSPFIGATTTADLMTLEEIFVCNYGWLALLLAASGVVFTAGSAALVLKHKTLAPEVFGFVTSMTYHNPYVKVPNGGSTLDAMERARLLKDVDVYVADVQGDEDVGHIAFAAGVTLRKLERGRLYA